MIEKVILLGWTRHRGNDPNLTPKSHIFGEDSFIKLQCVNWESKIYYQWLWKNWLGALIFIHNRLSEESKRKGKKGKKFIFYFCNNQDEKISFK